jgi:hypothetical protein
VWSSWYPLVSGVFSGGARDGADRGLLDLIGCWRDAHDSQCGGLTQRQGQVRRADSIRPLKWKLRPDARREWLTLVRRIDKWEGGGGERLVLLASEPTCLIRCLDGCLLNVGDSTFQLVGVLGADVTPFLVPPPATPTDRSPTGVYPLELLI